MKKKKIQEKFEELIPVYLKVVFEVFSFVHFILFLSYMQTNLFKERRENYRLLSLVFPPFSVFVSLWG